MQLPERGLLVADYINRKMATRLKKEGVQFIDTVGNAYIDCPPIYINVRGNDRKTTLTAAAHRIEYQIEGTGRAFTATGLKVVFAILEEPKLVDAPYRQIAEKAEVALGTVGWVLNDLKARGLVQEYKKGKRIDNYRKLLELWLEAYPLKLRPKLLLGEFTNSDPNWWKDINILKFHGCWGGEVAAAKLTNYLTPKDATIYLRGNLNQLAHEARLRKRQSVEDMSIEILRPFWPPGTGDKRVETVCPILVYANLVNTADPRNRETAKMIYDEHINQYIQKD